MVMGWRGSRLALSLAGSTLHRRGARGEPWRACELSSRGPVLAETGTDALACTRGVTAPPAIRTGRYQRHGAVNQSDRPVLARSACDK